MGNLERRRVAETPPNTLLSASGERRGGNPRKGKEKKKGVLVIPSHPLPPGKVERGR